MIRYEVSFKWLKDNKPQLSQFSVFAFGCPDALQKAMIEFMSNYHYDTVKKITIIPFPNEEVELVRTKKYDRVI